MKLQLEEAMVEPTISMITETTLTIKEGKYISIYNYILFMVVGYIDNHQLVIIMKHHIIMTLEMVSNFKINTLKDHNVQQEHTMIQNSILNREEVILIVVLIIPVVVRIINMEINSSMMTIIKNSLMILKENNTIMIIIEITKCETIVWIKERGHNHRIIETIVNRIITLMKNQTIKDREHLLIIMNLVGTYLH